MARIFVSYRREDTAGYAGRLFDTLRKAFGPKNVFRDIGIADDPCVLSAICLRRAARDN